jgi:serine protease Do
MQDFFNRFVGGQGGQGGQMPGAPGGEDMRERSLGSGVIVDSKGYIVTNAHVVEKADRIRVKLMNDPATVTYDATVIGTDKETDLASSRSNAKSPYPREDGQPESMQVGDWVLLGSPLVGRNRHGGHRFGARKEYRSATTVQSFIQTDAASTPAIRAAHWST